MSKPRILVITPVLPYEGVPNGGGTLLFHLLRGMKAAFEVDVAVMYEPQEREALERFSTEFKVICAQERAPLPIAVLDGANQGMSAITIRLRRVLFLLNTLINDLFLRTPRDVAVFSTALLSTSSLSSYDLIQIEYPLIFHDIVRRVSHPKAIGIAHDVMIKTYDRMRRQKSTGLHRALATLRYYAVRFHERRVYSHLKMIYVLSALDKAILENAAPHLSVKVRRTGFLPSRLSGKNALVDGMILFVGYLARGENQDGLRFFLEHVFPTVRERVPEASLHIVGSGAPDDLLRYHDGRHIVFHGYQHDLSSFYDSASVVIAPLFIGGGIIIKVIEGLMYGKAIVATSIANEGIEAPAGECIYLADTAEEFVEKVIRLLGDKGETARLSAAANAYFERHFHLDSVLTEITADYTDLLNSTT